MSRHQFVLNIDTDNLTLQTNQITIADVYGQLATMWPVKAERRKLTQGINTLFK